MSATYRREDGPAPAQASITIDAPVARPHEFKTPPTSSGTYPLTPTFGAHTMLRGDIALTMRPVDRENRYREDDTMKIFSSFAGQNKPAEDDVDSFCQQFMVVGLVKNNITNPDDANYMASQGTPRPNTLIAATMIDGGWGTDYNGNHVVRFGDLLIWEPPMREENKHGYRPKTNAKERMVAKLRPLDWTCYSNFYNQIGVHLINFATSGELNISQLLEGNRYGVYKGYKKANLQAALYTKRNIMVNIACALRILQDRGYIEIITPDTSKKRAALHALHQTVSHILKKNFNAVLLSAQSIAGLKSTQNITDVTSTDAATLLARGRLALLQIEKALLSVTKVADEIKSGTSNQIMDENESHLFSPIKFKDYLEDPDKEEYSDVYIRNNEDYADYKFGYDATNLGYDMSTIEAMKTADDASFDWITTILGLGADSFQQEHKAVTLDIINMLQNRHSMPEDSDIYFKSYIDRQRQISTGDEDVLSFIEHAKNSDVGMFCSWEMSRKVLESRIVGRATSAAPGNVDGASYKPGDVRIDMVLGPHYI